MSETPKNNYSLILLIVGLIFILASFGAIIGFGSLPVKAKEAIINYIKKSKPAGKTQKESESLKNTQDSMYIQQDTSNGNNLQMVTPADYEFKMKIDEAEKQQQDAINDYSYPTVKPGVPGSKEWQNEFWQEK